MKRQIELAKSLNATVSLPGSKYVANRLVIIAALSPHQVVLNNVVDNDDIHTAISGLNDLGYCLKRQGEQVIALANETDPSPTNSSIYTAHSGTFSRFITAVAGLHHKPVQLSGSEKMNTRPMVELFDAMRTLGVTVESDNDRLPATITGPYVKQVCHVDASRSSQYVSGLLLAAPLMPEGLSLHLVGDVVSRQYIDMTIALMQDFGVKVEQISDSHYQIAKGQSYQQKEMSIAPDPVSSSYFMAAAAICGGQVTLQRFDFNSIQGEAGFYSVLEDMGCECIREQDALTIKRQGPLKAVDRDMGEMPDVVQTLAAIACFAEGTTMIRNIAHLAYKESNRIADTANELKKCGVDVDYGDDYLAITGGGDFHKAVFETHDDHRMAMSLALVASQIEGCVINNAGVVSKSFPTYWDKLAEIGMSSFEC